MDLLTVSGKGIKVVSGGRITHRYNNKVSYKEYKPEVQFLQVPGFGMVENEFLVSCRGRIRIDYQSRKAGRRSLSVNI